MSYFNYTGKKDIISWVEFLIECDRKEAFEHNNPRDTFCTLQLFLNHFTVEIYSEIH